MKSFRTGFPYGAAVLTLLIVAVLCGAWLLLGRLRAGAEAPPDLVFALFAENHLEAYREVVPEFEAEHGVNVQMQLVPARGLQSRLQSAMLVGADVPDVVEIVNGSMGYFTKGPLEDVGFVDLTDRLKEEGIFDRLVQSRYSLWSSRGRVFALPHDVHPVALAYNRELVEQLGIDVDELDTWDKFVEVGRRVTRDEDGDGTPDRYMLDLPSDGGDSLGLLLLQNGGKLFNARGEVALDSDAVAETVIWYIHQTRGDDRIAFPAGWGQTLAKAMMDGLVLFYLTPDWRTKSFEMEVPKMAGKMGLMPLPAWEPGGLRTSTWGGTGICITKASEQQELAWEFVKFLYLKNEDLGSRFAGTNIIPPVKDAWDLDVFDEPNAFYGGQRLGRLYAEMSPDVPADYVSPYSELARNKLNEAFLSAAQHYERNGDEGLREVVEKELKQSADYVRRVMNRNRFLNVAEAPDASGGDELLSADAGSSVEGAAR